MRDRLFKFAAALCLLVATLSSLGAVSTGGYALINWDSADPAGACTKDQGIFINTTALTLWACPTTAWKQIARSEEVTTTTGLQFPQGAIMMIASGSCPAGFTQSTALNGKFPLGTIAANADIGGTGGSDNITPAGTNTAITAGTPAGTNAASATTGNCAATNLAIGTGATTACKATAPNLTVSAQTFTGTQLATHNHTFTGTQFDNRPAFVKVIFCVKN